MTEILSTDYYKLIDGRHGRFLANPADMYLGRSMIAYGEFSELEWHLLARLASPGAVVIEAGANMGAFTVPLAKAVGPQGMVYAFEPQLMVFQQLCANIALNDLVNVQAFNAGCGAEPGMMHVLRPKPDAVSNFGGYSLEKLKGEQGPKVRIEKLDDVIDPPRLTLLKADVEGMEIHVIRGAAGLIKQHRPLMYLEVHEADGPPLFRELFGLDYQVFWHQPPMFNPGNHFGNSENLFGRIVSRNILCVPSERGIKVEGLRKVAGEDDYPTKWSA